MIIGRKNYIFIKNKIFFDWQFYNSKRNTYNFVIAKQNEKIVGCLGFILNNNYSKTFKKKGLYMVSQLACN